jgi:DNA-binding transcriptional regulator YhcF (GntR family)
MSGDLDLSVDRTSDVPLGTQLLWRLRTRIASGELAAGARLPGIRELAELAGVNINTVRAVLSRLEEQGFVTTHHGRGSFVMENAQPNALLTQAAHAAAAQADAAGVDPRDLAEALYAGRRGRSPSAAKGGAAASPAPVPADQATSERRALRIEIASLESELAEIEPLGPLSEKPPAPQPRVLTASELRRVRDELAARVRQLRREQQLWRYEQERADAAESAAEAASREHRWTTGIWTGGKRAEVSWRTV